MTMLDHVMITSGSLLGLYYSSYFSNFLESGLNVDNFWKSKVFKCRKTGNFENFLKKIQPSKKLDF